MCRETIYILPEDPKLQKQLRAIQKQQTAVRTGLTLVLVGLTVVTLEIGALIEELRRSKKRRDD